MLGRILIYQGIIISCDLGTAHCHLNFYRKLFLLVLCLGCIDHEQHYYCCDAAWVREWAHDIVESDCTVPSTFFKFIYANFL